VEEVRVQELRNVREAGTGASCGPSGAGQRQLLAGARRHGVQP